MGTPCAASRAVLDQASVRWPGRNTASDGLCASAAHHQQNPTSDHEPDSRGICHAADLTKDLAHGVDTVALWNELAARADRRVKYLIRDRQIWNPSIAPYWRPYFGSNPHEKHGHVSILTVFEDDVSPWFGEGTGDLTMDQADRIIATIGRYEQDTRKLLIELEERQAIAARKVEGKRTRRILQAIADLHAGKAVDVEKVAADAEDDETPASVRAQFTAELDELSAALDDAVLQHGGLDSREDVDRFVDQFRSDLSRLT